MLDRFWDNMAWLLSREYRQIDREIEEEFRRFDANAARMADLDRRIAEVFTPEEWEATRKRCEAKLAAAGFPPTEQK